MYPRSFPIVSRALALVMAGSFAIPAIATAQQQQQDAPPVDIGQLLQALRTMRQQQMTQQKNLKQTAYQQIAAAAGSNERATAFWEEAVKATQMDGAGKENTQFKNWKEGDGEAFKEREVQNAVRLHLLWLGLTLQRSGGVPVKDLLPAIYNYSKELLNDEATMENVQEAIKHDRELGDKNPKKAQRSRDDAAMKKVHDGVINKSLNNSVVVQWLKLNDFITVDHWELNPGNIDGIYTKIVLPEMRAQKDQRVFEYWDMKLKKEADAASKTKLAFEIDKFNTQRRPTLLWNRAQEFAALGQKNRAANEMFALIKTYPSHPDADDWIAKLEALLMPPAAPTSPADTTAAPPSNNGAPGGVPATTAVPPATPKVPGL